MSKRKSQTRFHHRVVISAGLLGVPSARSQRSAWECTGRARGIRCGGHDIAGGGGAVTASPRQRPPRSAHVAVFAPLDPAGRVELVARRLSDAIVLGLLRDGEQLPSESDLALQLGVSTVTVREALTSLRHQEMVETRRGRGGGSFVRAPSDPATALLRTRLEELSLGDLRDLCD